MSKQVKDSLRRYIGEELAKSRQKKGARFRSSLAYRHSTRSLKLENVLRRDGVYYESTTQARNYIVEFNIFINVLGYFFKKKKG